MFFELDGNTVVSCVFSGKTSITQIKSRSRKKLSRLKPEKKSKKLQPQEIFIGKVLQILKYIYFPFKCIKILKFNSFYEANITIKIYKKWHKKNIQKI